jgi:hypothetical protein
VEKGRAIYAGIQKFVAFIMSVHIAEVRRSCSVVALIFEWNLWYHSIGVGYANLHLHRGGHPSVLDAIWCYILIYSWHLVCQPIFLPWSTGGASCKLPRWCEHLCRSFSWSLWPICLRPLPWAWSQATSDSLCEEHILLDLWALECAVYNVYTPYRVRENVFGRPNAVEHEHY